MRRHLGFGKLANRLTEKNLLVGGTRVHRIVGHSITRLLSGRLEGQVRAGETKGLHPMPHAAETQAECNDMPFCSS